jgi:hypothetical protein
MTVPLYCAEKSIPSDLLPPKRTPISSPDGSGAIAVAGNFFCIFSLVVG